MIKEIWRHDVPEGTLTLQVLREGPECLNPHDASNQVPEVIQYHWSVRDGEPGHRVYIADGDTATLAAAQQACVKAGARYLTQKGQTCLQQAAVLRDLKPC